MCENTINQTEGHDVYLDPTPITEMPEKERAEITAALKRVHAANMAILQLHQR